MTNQPSKLIYYLLIAIFVIGLIQTTSIVIGSGEYLVEYQWLDRYGVASILMPLNVLIVSLLMAALFFWIKPNGKYGLTVILAAILLPLIKDVGVSLLGMTDQEFTKQAYLISREARGASTQSAEELDFMFSATGILFSMLMLAVWTGIQLKIVWKHRSYLLRA